MGQGGVTFQETADLGYVMKYFGIPIIENNVMNSNNSTGTNTIDLLFGNFQRAALLGDRMGVELDVSDQRYWDENNIGIRGIIRHDINVHDVGSTSRVGPVVYLYQT
jgi:HK97 family phage major capsid protein